MQGRVITKYFDPFNSLGTKASAPSSAVFQKECQGTWRIGEPENTQLPPPSRVSAFDRSAQPCIPYLLEKVGINLPFLPLKDQQCVSSPLSIHKVVGENAFKWIQNLALP